MQVSRAKCSPQVCTRTPVATGIMLALASPALLAQQSAIEEITVTAQKREESLQDVPISIQTLGNEALEELNIQSFQDYARMLPSVSIEQNGTAGAGTSFSLVYMRGIATAGDGQATTSQPSVGMYLDELPITTIQGNIDVHMYDIARVEALAGPQGTLYGASSQAGTLRVITNKPELGEFSSSISVEANTINDGGTGYVGEGYVNAPIGDNAAIRLVGWTRSDAGWIDNKLGSRTFPGHADDPADDVTLTNTDKAEDDYNTIDVFGARAALRVDLNDNWTVTPTVMVQNSESEGSWGDDLNDVLASGDYAVTHFKDEYVDDEWWMVGLTIEGKVGNFDVVYSGSYLDRQLDGSFDYSDYSYFYELAYTSGFYSDLHFSDTGAQQVPNIFNDSFPPGSIGSRVMTGARYRNDDGYTKENHELRISTDPERRVRGLLGFFWQHQYHDFEQHWEVEGGVGTVMEMNSGQDDPRFEDTVYLNSMFRNDRDRAVFGSVSFDIRDDLELTLGARFFEPEVTVKGFFGFGLGFTTAGWSSNGENRCNLFPDGQADWFDKPCLNVDKGIKESENVMRANLTWDISSDHMIYGTWSEGYRPGGINRDPFNAEYVSDFLTNWELGWKTQWLDNRLQFNGALFLENWDDFQVSITGDNAITAVVNGPTAEVLGVEAQMLWLPTDNLRLSAAVAFYDTELQQDYCDGRGGDQAAAVNDCGTFDEDGDPTVVLQPQGGGLPVTADFKGNLIARYHFEVGGFDAYVQGALAHEGERGSDLDRRANAIKGNFPAYTTLDLSAGISRETWSLDLFIKNATGEDAALYKTAECTAETCGAQTYGVRVRPRSIGLKYTKDF